MGGPVSATAGGILISYGRQEPYGCPLMVRYGW